MYGRPRANRRVVGDGRVGRSRPWGRGASVGGRSRPWGVGVCV